MKIAASVIDWLGKSLGGQLKHSETENNFSTQDLFEKPLGTINNPSWLCKEVEKGLLIISYFVFFWSGLSIMISTMILLDNWTSNNFNRGDTVYQGRHPIEGAMPSPYLCERYPLTHRCSRRKTLFLKFAEETTGDLLSLSNSSSHTKRSRPPWLTIPHFLMVPIYIGKWLYLFL